VPLELRALIKRERMAKNVPAPGFVDVKTNVLLTHRALDNNRMKPSTFDQLQEFYKPAVEMTHSFPHPIIGRHPPADELTRKLHTTTEATDQACTTNSPTDFFATLNYESHPELAHLRKKDPLRGIEGLALCGHAFGGIVWIIGGIRRQQRVESLEDLLRGRIICLGAGHLGGRSQRIHNSQLRLP
jgi:hypothetical protein